MGVQSRVRVTQTLGLDVGEWVVEHLHTMHEASDLIHNTKRKKKTTKETALHMKELEDEQLEPKRF